MAVHVADYIVLGISVIISIIIGICVSVYKKKRINLFKFFYGDKKLNSTFLGISLAVTFQASPIMVGHPAEGYAYGIQYILAVIPMIIAFTWTGMFVAPLLIENDINEIFGYFQIRFSGSRVRLLATTLSLLEMVLVIAMGTFSFSLVLSTVAGVPLWAGIIITIASTLMYTTLGGYKAVVLADIFQAAIMWIGMTLLLVKCCTDAGSIGYILTVSKERLSAFSFSFDPRIRQTVWSILFCKIFLFQTMLFSPPAIQRLISARSIKRARHATCTGLILYGFFWVLVIVVGVVIFAYFTKLNCDPFASHTLHNINQILPYAVVQLFSDFPGLTGIFIAALAAATLSTVSSVLSGIAACFTEDILKSFWVWQNETRLLAMSKMSTVAIGVFAGVFAYLLSFSKGPLMQIMVSISGAVSGPRLAMFLLSFHFRRATPRGIYVGIIFGILISGWLGMGIILTPDLPRSPMLSAGPTAGCHVRNVSSNANYSHSISMSTHGFNETLNVTADKEDNYQFNVEHHFESTVRDEIYQTSTTAYKKQVRVSGIDNVYTISYLFTYPIGTVVTIFVAVVVSLVQTRGTRPEVDPKLLISYTKCFTKNDNTLDSDSNYIRVKVKENDTKEAESVII